MAGPRRDPAPLGARRVPDALRVATAELSAAGNGSARVDAELLLAHLLGTSRTGLLLAGELTEPQRVDYAELIGRRAQGIPLQHLTGTAPFRRLQLAVGAGAFIPRPETELILELAAAELAAAATVVDLCAGSGAIALAVADEYPHTVVLAVERAPAALVWLNRNASARTAAGDRPVRVVAADIGEAGLLAELGGRVDVVLSNPPYVPESIRAELPVEVGHDPADAVFAGPDGLALMPAVIGLAARLLRAGGRLVIEHDESQRDTLPALFGATDWVGVTGHPDLAGRARFTAATRR